MTIRWRLWDMASGQEKRTFTGHTDWVNSVVFSPDGTMLASGSNDHRVRLWDVATGEGKSTLTGHTRAVGSVVFRRMGRRWQVAVAT